MSFRVPPVYDNPLGWGPPAFGETFQDVPYAPFSKGDRLGRAADWNQAQYQQQRYGRERGTAPPSGPFSYFHVDDDESFQMVDSKVQKPKQFGMQRRSQQTQSQRNVGGGRALDRRAPPQGRSQGKGRQPGRRSDRDRAWGDRRARTYGPDKERSARLRDPTVTIRADWNAVEQLAVSQLQKMSLDVPEPQDLVWAGSLAHYNKLYDRVTVRECRKLKIAGDLETPVTTTDDPIIRKLSKEGVGTVFATDTILSTLMCSLRSVYGWDVLVQRVGSMVFLDKRASPLFDHLTVSETCHDHPDDKDPINSPRALSEEATKINWSFSQQVLSQGEKKTFEVPNPFAEEGKPPRSIGYRYRQWVLDEDITVVARCSLDGFQKGAESGNDSYITVNALNEWDPRGEWRHKLDTQRGAILATELKNNSCKLAKWTTQALLAGADQMKLGFVSRESLREPQLGHTTLGMQTFKPKDFATQINLSVPQMWGILKGVIDVCMKLSDGRYILVKEPSKGMIRVFDVPSDAFDEVSSEQVMPVDLGGSRAAALP